MTARSPISISNLLPYLPVILLFAAAAPLGLSCGVLWALGAFGLAVVFLVTIRRLQSRLEEQAKSGWLLDEGLRQTQKLAAIGQLSAGVAHEINNPLAIIRQEAQWMQTLLQTDHFRGVEEVKELYDSLREIIQQVDRCKEITHNLLDFARKRQPVIQGVAVNKLIEDMAALVAKEARQKGIKIILRLAPDLPQVYADAPQLRQVILNLLNNATYAVQRNGEVTATTRLAGKDSLEIIVSDTGPGIPPEDLPRIFDPFFTTKPPGQGTGLGLSICHGIIEKLGGRITVASQVGQGTAFTIRLPLKPREGVGGGRGQG
ncbi:MAG: two-component sensor histidine kinase [Deltaproteobacteria bacterium]|nr:two-component sensor histidine kinase [Deltaproteobacteria bacterium]MBI4794891.1 two-component sensor histidine kinase [Deltaproteobacteria bacterium]